MVKHIYLPRSEHGSNVHMKLISLQKPSVQSPAADRDDFPSSTGLFGIAINFSSKVWLWSQEDRSTAVDQPASEICPFRVDINYKPDPNPLVPVIWFPTSRSELLLAPVLGRPFPPFRWVAPETPGIHFVPRFGAAMAQLGHDTGGWGSRDLSPGLH